MLSPTRWTRLRETQIAFDTKLQRPGSPEIQRSLGGAPWHVSSCFPVETWLDKPTKSMKLYPLNEELLEQIVAASIEATIKQNKKGR